MSFPARIAAACLLLLGAAGPSGFASECRPLSACSAVAAAEDPLLEVGRALRADPAESSVALTARLVQLGAARVPAMFATLQAGALRDEPAGDDVRTTALDPRQRAALLLALKEQPAAWRALFEELAATDADRETRRAAVDAVGDIGDSQDFRLLLELLKPAKPAKSAEPAPAPAAQTDPAPAPAAVTTPAPAPASAADPLPQDEDADLFESVCSRILARDRLALARLEALLFVADPLLQPPSVRAIEKLRTLPALETLTRLLGRSSELDQLLLTEICKCASALSPPFDNSIEQRVRTYLGSFSADLQREAALAVGKLEDDEALPQLVTLLTHANRGVRQNAYWSLRKLTGLAFAPDPKAWGPWLEEESKWWRERAPALFSVLADAKLPDALAAVQEIARQRYPRHPLATELTRALTHKEGEVRRLTCLALARFRSRTALPGLIACLDDEDEAVRKAAGDALNSVTGLDLPAERAAWALAGY